MWNKSAKSSNTSDARVIRTYCSQDKAIELKICFTGKQSGVYWAEWKKWQKEIKEVCESQGWKYSYQAADKSTSEHVTINKIPITKSALLTGLTAENLEHTIEETKEVLKQLVPPSVCCTM